MKSLDNKDLYKIIKELNKESPWNHYFWLNEELQTLEKVVNLKSEGSNLEKWNKFNPVKYSLTLAAVKISPQVFGMVYPISKLLSLKKSPSLNHQVDVF